MQSLWTRSTGVVHCAWKNSYSWIRKERMIRVISSTPRWLALKSAMTHDSLLYFPLDAMNLPLAIGLVSSRVIIPFARHLATKSDPPLQQHHRLLQRRSVTVMRSGAKFHGVG